MQGKNSSFGITQKWNQYIKPTKKKNMDRVVASEVWTPKWKLPGAMKLCASAASETSAVK